MNAPPPLHRRHYALLTAGFLLFVIYGSLVPLVYKPKPFGPAWDFYAARMTRGITFDMRSDWAANVLLFIPLGYLYMGALTADRPRPAWGLALVPFFALFSAAIEFAQVWFPRDTNPNDVVAETIGGVIGVVGWLWQGQPLTDRFRQFMTAFGPGDWAVRVLPAYLLFLAFTQGMPFDLTISPSILRDKARHQLTKEEFEAGHATIAVAPPAYLVPEKSLQSAAYFTPVGALLAFLPGRRWRGRPAVGMVVVSALAVAGGIELLQLIVWSCNAFATDVPLGAACVVVGWWAASRPRSFSRPVWLAAAGVWVTALLAVLWTPFAGHFDRFAEFSRYFEWMPFREYIDANYLNGMNKILHRVMLYAPAGFLLGRATGGWAMLVGAAGCLIGVVAEVGQLAFTDHTASISDVILGGLGAWCGGVVAARAPKSVSAGPVEAPKADAPPFRLL